MHDRVAALDIGFEHGERVAAGQLEILLDLDLDVRPRQCMAQAFAIGAELIRHAGEKQFYVRHSPPPASWPWRMWHIATRAAKRRLASAAPWPASAADERLPSSQRCSTV